MCDDCRDVVGAPGPGRRTLATVWALQVHDEGARLTGYVSGPNGPEVTTVQEADLPEPLRNLLPRTASRDTALPFALDAEVYYLPLVDDPGPQAPVDQVGPVVGPGPA